MCEQVDEITLVGFVWWFLSTTVYSSHVRPPAVFLAIKNLKPCSNRITNMAESCSFINIIVVGHTSREGVSHLQFAILSLGYQ